MQEGTLRQHRIAFGELNDVAALSTHPALARTEVRTPSGSARLVAPPARLSGGTRVLGPVPELARIWRLLTTPELRQTPRVNAFFDFIVEEIDALRPILTG